MNGRRRSGLVGMVGVVLLSMGAVLAQERPADGAWLALVSSDIAASEYEVSWQPTTVLADLPAAWQAPNRAQGFRTYFLERGIRVVPRTEQAPSWEWGLALVGFGRGSRIWPVAGASLQVVGNRVEYQRGGIVEWYENAPRGLEQGFSLAAPPGAAGVGTGLPAEETAAPNGPADRRLDAARRDGAAFVQLALTGSLHAAFSTDGLAIDFRTAGGVGAVHFASLRVTDSRGHELPAWMEGFAAPGGRAVRIVFHDADAVYPVTIDPLATSPAWTAESDQAAAFFGGSVATAGDVNGDGYSDVIVGTEYYDSGQTDEGRAFVYLGSASGLATTPAWTAESDQALARFGRSVATAGDVNGDGYSDVIVGAHWYDNGQEAEGRAFVYLGSASGLATAPGWTAESDQEYAYFGYVATAGDVNGDGYSDVIVGADGYDNDLWNEGRVFVYFGSAMGLATAPAWTAESDQADSLFGSSVASAGDVNGDGYSDVIVGADYYDNGQETEGRAFVYLGSASGLATAPAWIAESDQVHARFGRSVATAGDVNGDGFSDVIVGADYYDNGQLDEGRAFVYLGSASGLATAPAWTAESDQAFARFGFSVATAGDVNGDGYADVVVGAQVFDNGQADEGRAFVYLGSAAGLAATAVWTAECDQTDAGFGNAVATAGDVNGDGYSDVIVGADHYDNGQEAEGRAYVYLGSASGLAPFPAWTAESNQAGADFGYSVATAGDVNGDGYSDVIVGAAYYDNGQTDEGRAFLYLGSASGLGARPAWTAESNQASAFFGTSVATAGDVNGDGYSDVVVGAHYYDNGQADEGRAFVYLGSASGLAPFPAWTAESDQPSAYLGLPVAPAGDVNGDGYSDLIVGAHYYDNGQIDEGRAFVYLGSAAGLGSAPTWTAESDQTSALFAFSVATAGDVNGDGYSDVIVGAFNYDNGQTDEGRAFVYLGSAAGLATAPAWTAESDQASAHCGSAATAGDVNGDGYSDVIVGANWYDDGQTDEGRAYVYLGSASGLATAPAWTVESNQASSYFGYPVSTAGDVNGDGYSDVIVGAHYYDSGQTDEGQASVYLGSASGLATRPDWTAESHQIGALFGISVATAGDVNGDGYSDVIVGANRYDNGQTNEGQAFVYYGNGGPGLSLQPQQRSSTDARAVVHLGASDSPDSFRLALLGRTPFGRGKVRLEWEVKPLGERLTGWGTQTSVHWTDAGPGGTRLSQLASDLREFVPYHWRLRLWYHRATTPFQTHGRWLSVPWAGWQEWALRTSGPSAAGRVPDGIGGAPLSVGRADAVKLTLSWAASCLATDTDYAIYEGELGTYYSHGARYCSTGGATTQTLTPLAGDTYYLVVPLNRTREGSYGRTGEGVERPAALAACLPQQIMSCP